MGCGSSQPVQNSTSSSSNKTALGSNAAATTTTSNSVASAAAAATVAANGASTIATTTTTSKISTFDQRQLLQQEKEKSNNPDAATTTATAAPTVDGTSSNNSSMIGGGGGGGGGIDTSTATTVVHGNNNYSNADAGSVTSKGKKSRHNNNNTAAATSSPLKGLLSSNNSYKKQQKGSNNKNNNNNNRKNNKNGGSGGKEEEESTIRLRADTWETTMTDDLHQYQSQQEQQQLPPGLNGHNDNDQMDTTTTTAPDVVHLNQLYNDIPSIGGKTATNTNVSISQPRILHHQGSTSFTTTTKASSTTIGPIQEQWCTIWDRHVPHAIVDPQDVISVFYTIIQNYINRLSVVQLHCIRYILQNTIIQQYLPPTTNLHTYTTSNVISNHNSNGIIHHANLSGNNHLHTNHNNASKESSTAVTSKIVAKVFSSGNNNNNNNNNSNNTSTSIYSTLTPAEKVQYNESRQILDKYQLLNRTILIKLLPKIPMVVSQSTGNYNNINNTIQESIIILLLAMGDCYTHTNTSIGLQRLLIAAQQAITTCNINLDVNNNYQTNIKMPKPSQIPVYVDEQPMIDLPIGTSYGSLSSIIAMACCDCYTSSINIAKKITTTSTSSNRATTISSTIVNQKLQLLFYICIEPTKLQNFILLHPAGGLPIWLYEVGNNTVLSLPSLTHYHYYGNTFLPSSNSSNTTSATTNHFIPSKSRTPIHVDATYVQNIIRQILLYCIQQEQKKKKLMATNTTTILSPTNQSSELSSPTTTSEKVVSAQSEGRRNSFTVPTFGRRANSTESMTTTAMQNGVGTTNGDIHHNNNNLSIQDGVIPTAPSLTQQQVIAMNGANNNNSNNKTVNNNSRRSSKLMAKLSNVMNGTEIDTYYNFHDNHQSTATTTTELEDLLQQYDTLNAKYLQQYDVTEWNIQEFKNWCDAVLLLPPSSSSSNNNSTTSYDLRILQLVMHHLFGYGILPSPMMEYELVLEQWYAWEKEYYPDIEKQLNNNSDGHSIAKMFTDSVSVLMGSPQQPNSGVGTETKQRSRLGAVFGGLGGIDGLGGLGTGVMYCIPKQWWDQWTVYVNWSFAGETTNIRRSSKQYTSQRPSSLQTELLLENDPEKVTRGIMGSFEVMKENLQCNVDYVLVPPGVWDVLYELYSGGPPLPRMVKIKEVTSSFISLMPSQSSVSIKSNTHDEDFLYGKKFSKVMRLPSSLLVETHPFVFHAHICDPLQPYRRGDTGLTSIRVMASPKQPFWRLLSEIICRFTFQTYRAFDSDMRGRVRLWKKIETTKDTPAPRYGPWNLLCKSRYAILPYITNGVDFDGNYDELIANWKLYGDDATVESIGLEDQETLMVEFAVLNRSGELTWPREAAAEAGKVRRLADEDKQFRQLLLGVDDTGKKLLNPPNLIDMDVDAMEFSGKWYTVKILEVQLVEVEAEEDDDVGIEAEVSDVPKKIIKKKVRVSFRDHGGHMDWIDVDSDRLQTPGRFASEANLQSPESPTTSTSTNTNGDGRSKSGVGAKRSNSAPENSIHENTKICILPSFGACGLSNLGNSCYMNSAVQCMAYLPLLRAYLLGSLYKANGDLNTDNPLGTGGRLLEEFADLLRAMWSAKLAEKTPTRFRTHLGKSNEQFACADQQDAQEFLNYMIDVLHEDSNRVRKKPYVEALEDTWVEQMPLYRVGEESWRRFLRRNQSIMADVSMGQALNTVTCPVCNYSSRNFDPFNLLSIPIPTVADAVFLCTVIRRSTARNCPWILNRARKGDTRSTTRFLPKKDDKNASHPPSDTFSTEQYVIALSRLADGGDLRMQIQNLTGIRADNLRLCRAESILVNNKSEDGASTKRYLKVLPLTDKEGPASHLLKARTPNDESPRMPTQIVAFEMTLKNRQMITKEKSGAIDADADVVEESEGASSNSEVAKIERYLSVYGDEKECRQVDTDPIVLARAVSKSLWPRVDSEMRVGLRVDAKDHRGNWFVGSVVDVIEEAAVTAGDSDTGEEVTIQQKKVRVHFDNFLPKWDEYYTIEHFKKGRVFPLYSYAEPKQKPTEFVVHHRYSDRAANQSFLFGQSFYVQCHIEWSNARACAHIIAQASRYLQYHGKEIETVRLFEKVHTSVSDLVDYLIDCDREYIRRALGISEQSEEDAKISPYRNPTFASSAFISETNKRIATLLQRLPFELRLCSVEPTHGTSSDEITFPFAFNVTVGNFISTRNSVVIHWREPSVDKKATPQRVGIPSIMYMEPFVHMHESTAALKSNDSTKDGTTKKDRSNDSEIDLQYCLTEFCKVQKLPMSDNWVCPRCKVIREGGQNMNLWRVPDLLTFHIKRFNMSARWQEKVITKVNFPMTGLDMSQWCHAESPVLNDATKDSCIYDLIGVMNHYGSLTGGHYVATCKATMCGRDGKEDVAYNFNGYGINDLEALSSTLPDDPPSTGGWSLSGRTKPKINQGRIDATINSQSVSDSCESMWLQFDDEVVEIVPPHTVVSEMAYVLFYRKRHITPSNVAKYALLE